ncbi:MAG TPA: DUF222 domain-containing protein [Candidatus Nitrosopolaris sp.]|nr:DUF222 domain-containing protein [Candidatus Nitrosopolaris sp.]
MAALGMLVEPAKSELQGAAEDLKIAVQRMATCIRAADAAELGEGLIQIREVGIDPLEAVFAKGLRRFDKSGEYKADGALSAVAWVRERCNLSGGAAAERVNVARQLETLPQIEKALAKGNVGYQHVALIARAAENVGSAPVQKEEQNLLKAAQTMDPGRFAVVAKGFEHRVDAAAALLEANHAYERRYLHLSEPQNGMVRLDGMLDLEGGATLKAALSALMPPPANDDDRTPGQRRIDALVDLARRPLDGSKLGTVGGQRPHLLITASAETLLGLKGAPPAEMAGVGPIPMETAQRLACDPTVSWLLGQAELESESASDAHRQIPAATRRALVARDRDCVFNGCHRPAIWCDGHHLVWWTRGGKTALPNLALVCGRHHRMLHEEGWTLERKDGRWVTRPPGHRVPTNARSA